MSFLYNFCNLLLFIFKKILKALKMLFYTGECGMVIRCVVNMIKNSAQLFPENFDEYRPEKPPPAAPIKPVIFTFQFSGDN